MCGWLTADGRGRAVKFPSLHRTQTWLINKARLPDTKLWYNLLVSLSIRRILGDVSETAPPHMEEFVAIH